MPKSAMTQDCASVGRCEQAAVSIMELSGGLHVKGLGSLVQYHRLCVPEGGTEQQKAGSVN